MKPRDHYEALYLEIQKEVEAKMMEKVSRIPAKIMEWLSEDGIVQESKVSETANPTSAASTVSRGNIVKTFHEALCEFADWVDNRTVRERYEKRTGVAIDGKQASNYLSYLVEYGKAEQKKNPEARGNLYKAK